MQLQYVSTIQGHTNFEYLQNVCSFHSFRSQNGFIYIFLEWPLLGSELKKAGQANYSQAQVIVNTQQGMLHTHTDRQTHTTTVITSSKKASPFKIASRWCMQRCCDLRLVKSKRELHLNCVCNVFPVFL